MEISSCFLDIKLWHIQDMEIVENAHVQEYIKSIQPQEPASPEILKATRIDLWLGSFCGGIESKISDQLHVSMRSGLRMEDKIIYPPGGAALVHTLETLGKAFLDTKAGK